MSKPPEIRVRFIITDFSCAPEKITESLGLQPSETWKTGDPLGSAGIRKYKENGWMLALEPTTSEISTSKLVGRLLNRLEPSFEAIKSLPREAEVELSIVIYMVDETPELHLTKSQILQLSQLRAEVDVHLYVLTP